MHVMKSIHNGDSGMVMIDDDRFYDLGYEYHWIIDKCVVLPRTAHLSN